MDRCRKILFSVTNLILIVLAAWIADSSAQDNNLIQLSGSRYMYFGITDMARLYSEHNPKCNIVVTHAENHSALPALVKKTSDAIMVLGGLDDDAKSEASEAGLQLFEHVVGWGAVVIVVDPENPLTELTLEQVRKIFLGQIQNWKEVEGMDQPIAIMSRDEAMSGTEDFFRKSVLDGQPMAQQTIRVLDHNIVNAVWKRKGSIADARSTEAIRGRIQGKVKVLGIRENEESPAVIPSMETVRNRSYPMSAPLVMYYDVRSGSPALKDFVAFCSRRGLGELYAGSKSNKTE